MKRRQMDRGRRQRRHRRSGLAAQEVAVAMVLVVTFTFTMYLLAQDSLMRLFHFISTTVGGPFV